MKVGKLKILPLTYEEFNTKYKVSDKEQYKDYLVINRRIHHYGIFSGLKTWYEYQVSNKRI